MVIAIQKLGRSTSSAIIIFVRRDRLAITVIEIIGSKPSSRKSGVNGRLRICTYLR
jgi:hypothetical protein